MPDPNRPDPYVPDGSALCRACGLCCKGVLHASVPVAPEAVARVRALGLTVEPIDAHSLGFGLPCPLYRDQACSVYSRRPPACQAYKCALLRRHEAQASSFDESVAIVRRAQVLVASVAECLPAGFVLDRLRAWIAHRWDAGGWLLESEEPAQAGAEVALRAIALMRYLATHFRTPPAGGGPPSHPRA